MECKVCGAESGKYPLCRSCNEKKEKGQIIKCTKCGNWHPVNSPCKLDVAATPKSGFLYDPKPSLLTAVEQTFYAAIKECVPNGYLIFPQVNLASFIVKTDSSRYRNEMFRNVDFLVTDGAFAPKFVVEINDRTHMNTDRRERDEKVKNICEEAGIPVLTLWTSYGVNKTYIKQKIDEILGSLPVTRIRHFDKAEAPETSVAAPKQQPAEKKGCYVATCVYGSYDCPEVWVLRRFRDRVLAKSMGGRAFIKTYYAVSPRMVKLFGAQGWFRSLSKFYLDKMVRTLRNRGYESTPYSD